MSVSCVMFISGGGKLDSCPKKFVLLRVNRHHIMCHQRERAPVATWDVLLWENGEALQGDDYLICGFGPTVTHNFVAQPHLINCMNARSRPMDSGAVLCHFHKSAFVRESHWTQPRELSVNAVNQRRLLSVTPRDSCNP